MSKDEFQEINGVKFKIRGQGSYVDIKSVKRAVSIFDYLHFKDVNWLQPRNNGEWVEQIQGNSNQDPSNEYKSMIKNFLYLMLYQ